MMIFSGFSTILTSLFFMTEQLPVVSFEISTVLLNSSFLTKIKSPVSLYLIVYFSFIVYVNGSHSL